MCAGAEMSPVWVGVISSILNLQVFHMLKKKTYKAEHLLRVTVFAYADPVRLHAVPTNNPFFENGRIIYSDKIKAIGYQDGFKVQYAVRVYLFRKVEERRLPVLVRYMRIHNYKYPGILHHANLYGGISKQFVKMVKLAYVQ